MRTFVSAIVMSASLIFLTGVIHAAQRPAVLELFTSEGCSSCPPAETYVGELAKRADVLALSFHVDYWDDLGWRDRFVIPEATPRQRTYAKTLHLSTVYTPQMVIDGRANFVGSDRRSIGGALNESRSGIPVAIAVRDGAVVVNLISQPGISASEVVLVAYQQSAVSAIGRGENSGRTLTEYNIARAVRPLGQYAGRAEEYRAQVASLPREATDVAVLVQLVGQGPVIAAASCSLR
jgi:hypothetical protein